MSKEVEVKDLEYSEEEYQKSVKNGKMLAVEQLKTEIIKAGNSRDRISAAKEMINVGKENSSGPSVAVNFNMGELKDGLEGLKQLAENTEVLIKEDEK